MRSLPALLVATVLFVPAAGRAAEFDVASLDGCELHAPVTWGHRHDPRRVQFAIDTDDRAISLVLTDDVVALQLTDRTMHRVDRELAHERNRDVDDNAFADVVRDAVMSGVRSLLDHSLECPLDELRDVRIRDGRLELVTRDGDRIFAHVREDGDPVLARFSDSDQRAFVEAFHRLRDRRR